MRLSIQKYFPVVLTASFLLANLFNFATRRSEAQPITPEERIEQAWELARASGSYDYFSQVEQTSYPLPSLANTSREPQTDLMTLDGSVNFPEESMEMTLWQNGGGQLEDGLTIRVADGKTEARIGENEWQEIGHVADAFAPNADPLMFVDSAVNVEFAGSETRQVGDLTLTFDRYTFDLDGAVYANNMRRQAEERLQKYGTLPGGLEINTGEIYRNMEGSGELWLDPSGLPQRITIQTDIPPYRGSSRLVANIVTDFSDFDYDRIAAAQTPFIDQPAAWVALRQPELLETARQIASTIILTAAFGLVGLFFIRFYRHPKLYAWFAGLMVLGLIVPPLAHAEQARAFSENFHEDQIQQESRIAEANEIEAAKEDLRQADWNPHLEPGVQHSEVSNPSEIPLFQPSAITRQSAAINTTDSDDDGLIDTDEEYWGSCAYLVGTTEYNNEANCAGVTDPTDSDGDGLSDVTEVHDLGLMPAVADTDADGINDRLEVTGFVYNGQTWYLNPNEQDSNKDGIIDSAECLVWYDASPTFNESGVCPDSDGDGDPDIFDSDNDGDGVPDAEDLSMNVGGGQTFDDDNPFELTIDNLTIDQSVLVNLQLKPTNDNNLSLYSHVLDWPTNDTEGQITRYNDTTWANTSNGSIQSSADNAANGDIRLVPMLEITMPYDSGRYANLPVLDAAPNTRVLGQTVDTWLDQDELDPFSITINDVDTSTGDLVAFIPFTTVTDETDAIVAYSSQMLYRPGQGTGGVADWGSAHQFRFVWLVQMITDECVNADDDPDTCTRQDVMTVAHVYDESWQLTGLEVSEELGLSSALLYEDPTADDDLNFDDQLWTLSWNFSNTLMRGRDYINNTTGAQGSDGLRDVTVNNLDSSIDDWFGVDRYVNVVQQNYAHEAYMAHFVSTEGSNVLDTVFTPYASQTTPTLLYVHENESRTLNLDSIGGAVSASTTIDLDPASVKPEIISSMSWTPYSYTGGSWDGYDTESYLDLLAYRLETDSYFQPADSSSESEAIASGK
ncbi:MAG: hypothetical protein QNJ45_24360, partial [Ardenticatenaceae bacterium]|nr:hypothetical protein [Ardenticatenaceae bacterium]